MPRKSATVEEQMLALLSKVKNEGKPEKIAKQKDISKALQLFRKGHAMIEEAIAMLEGGDEPANDSPEYQANVTKYPQAPYGRKADGTPKLASGKGALSAEAMAFRMQYPELFDKKVSDPGHGGSNVAEDTDTDSDRPGHGGSTKGRKKNK
ncbi:hypothetical protein HNQ93_001260 [Hymenobacter luteus]|uniref:Uncharacterized protein n=2 Tax=Hymenobacter TaxID=89966 RepID=A0A7W9T0S8_9BACT|nr:MULTISPECIES: hypothetical protein [Hymenobacter]MBB4601379.1 hypothetical protein [Hymenobacter latericoloratus]MBB6058414.1 hypothetical protein [Hymenobacter luteus]